jgi:SHS2 domain-containing protein
MPWQLFDHTADVGLRIDAPTPAGVFEEAGRALASLLVEDLDAVEPRETHRFGLEAADREDLLFDWLQALLVCFELRGVLLTRFRVTLEGSGLRAVATGERVDPDRHRLAHEVKAITYHGLSLRPAGGGWRAEVIVDI